MSLPYNQELISRAKELRKNMTPQENMLWHRYLKSYPIRFQRQKTIKSFIADFYCHKARLIIEIDGSQHYTEQGLAYDNERTAILKEFNLEVIRFSNYDINTNFESVCMEIDKVVKKRISLLNE
ncbi:MAG: endonuclease domain-containing protein [Clostridia bacterium]|nr:endonuclease domain-containing protein [Clostridia bacterium]